MIIDTVTTDEYEWKLERVVDPETDTPIVFAHIDMFKFTRDTLGELRVALADAKDKYGTISFYSSEEASIRLANALEPLEAVLGISFEGVEAKVGIWGDK